MRTLREPTHTPAARGFSMVEATVAFGLFLVIAAFITWSLSASFATQAQAAARATTSAALTTALDELATTPTTDLLSDRFTVPYACPDTPDGIAGTSCVPSAGVTTQISYRFTSPGTTGATCPADSVDPTQVLAAHGTLTVQACVTGTAAHAFEDLHVLQAAATQTRTLVPDTPGHLPGTATVLAHLDGPWEDLAERPVLLVDATDPQNVHATATPDRGVARLDLTPGVCTVTSPCALALSTSPTPELTDPADDPAEDMPQLRLTDRTPGNPVTAPTAGTTHVYAELSIEPVPQP